MDVRATKKPGTDVVDAQRLYTDPRVDEAPRLQPDNPDRVSSSAPKRLEIGPKLRYRADIDALRAIAVLSVLAYHLQINLFQGGFVGVDVFFVISGYLISAIILKDIAAGKFSIASFYERRVRRIAPALLVALLVTSVFAVLYLLPTELVNFAKSLLAALFSASNLYFWKQSGYFSATADVKPLLHTWSLAIEEQFYFFLPVFLTVAYRCFPRRMRLSIVLIAIASFALSAVETFRDPTAAFYLLHSRAWELLLGALISLEVFPDTAGPVVRNVAAAAGTAMICAAVFTYSSVTPFPGGSALLPCLGTALVIWAGRSGDTLFNRALSFKPLVFVGLISYSLYLWHWPIVLFQGMQSTLGSGASPRISKLISILMSLGVATLSWRFVELPFRSGQKRPSRAVLFQVAAGAAAVVAALGFTLILLDGVPTRYSWGAIQVASYLNYKPGSYFREGTCFISSGYEYRNFDTSKCLQLDPRRKNYLLVGDSYAGHLWYGLSTTLNGVNLLQATASGCRPTPEQPTLVDETCKRLTNYVYEDFLPKHPIDRLLIAARWQEQDLAPLSRELDWARGRGIVVSLFGPMIQYDAPLPRLLALSIRKNDLAIPDEHRVDERRLDDAMSALAGRKGVDYISFYQALCGTHSCDEFAADGIPLQFDSGHLTKEGSVVVAQKVSQNVHGL